LPWACQRWRFSADGQFLALPLLEASAVTEVFRRMLLLRLHKGERLTERFMQNLLSWVHSGFSVYAGPPVNAAEIASMEVQARYITRPALDLDAIRELDDGRLVMETPADPRTGATSIELDHLEWIHRITSHIPDPDILANRSVRLGIAFHEAMESLNLCSPEPGRQLIQELIVRRSLDPKSARSLEEMIGVTLSSSLLERVRLVANSGGRVLREVPFVRPLDGSAVEEGKIDLLFEEKDGWVLVDFKTDWIAADAQETENYFRQKYSYQIGEYVKALRILPINVVSAYILLARTGSAIEIC
jgi:hypothetical protein